MKKDLLSTGLARIIAIAASIIQGIIVARFLLEEGKGVISLYAVALNLTLSLGDLGGKQSYAYAMSKKGWTAAETLPYVWRSYGSALLIELVLLLTVLWSQELMHREHIVVALLALMAVRLYNSYSYSYALARRNIKLINLCNVLDQVLALVVMAWFIAYRGRGEVWYFVGMLVGAGSVGVLLTNWRRNLLTTETHIRRESFDWGKWKMITLKGLTYAIPLFVLGLNYRLDVFIVDHFWGVATVAIYSQGASLAQMLWLLPEVMNLVIFSYSLNTIRERSFANALLDNLSRMMKVMGLLLIPIGVIAYYLIPIIYGTGFAQSSDVFVIILPGVFLMILFKSLNGDLAARGYPMIAAYVFTPAVALNVMLNFLLIPSYGAIGAAWASTISYSLASVTYYSIYRRMTDKLTD